MELVHLLVYRNQCQPVVIIISTSPTILTSQSLLKAAVFKSDKIESFNRKDSLMGSPFFNISQKIWKFYEIVLTKYIYYGRTSVELKNGVIPMEKTFI